MPSFELKSKFSPTGDQPEAIRKLARGISGNIRHQTLLGATGSGKTFTVANVVAEIRKPTLVISHNKTLAAQLYQEFKEFFPNNAVHYFVSYYDYYQPEAYIPQSDIYIEKDAKINEMIESLRHAATASILTRKDVLVVASVSCIYGLGSPEEYDKTSIDLKVGDIISSRELIKKLVSLQYVRNPLDPKQGHFRQRENTIEIYLPSGEEILRIDAAGNKIKSISLGKTDFDSKSLLVGSFRVFPAKHFVTPDKKLELAMSNIRQELKNRLAELDKQGKILEAARLKQRTEFDLETLATTGYVNGIENYSRQLDFREAGTPPYTLLDYFRFAYEKKREDFREKNARETDFLTIIDESHATIPQLRGMYKGDQSRKKTLIDYGFRLPSARDNRPLTFNEFDEKNGKYIYVSATPAEYELKKSAHHIAEQVIRPTGILDPKTEIRPTKGQIRDIVKEIKKRIAKKERSLVLTLTKRLAEDVSDYLIKEGINAEYLHSEIKTFERTETLRRLRSGEKDVIVGINLLREGLDLPEVSFIAILDADKEGFLRNKTTLLQIIGRAARHVEGEVILYADFETDSIKKALEETERRRRKQEKYNKERGLTPQAIRKEIRKSILEEEKEKILPILSGPKKEIIKELQKELKKAAKELNFELAAQIRDKIKEISG